MHCETEFMYDIIIEGNRTGSHSVYHCLHDTNNNKRLQEYKEVYCHHHAITECKKMDHCIGFSAYCIYAWGVGRKGQDKVRIVHKVHCVCGVWWGGQKLDAVQKSITTIVVYCQK